MEKTDIRSMTLDELECFVMDGLGDKKFRARQIYDWMHVKLVQSCLLYTSPSPRD